ncbi:MAG: DUF1015 family protein [Firmicutes bacterium]|nr:DUF1015 family protein [Bacillota bacterium]
MAVVRPFKGLRPKNQEIAENMISLPYDVMNRKEAKDMAGSNPFSFLKIVRSEINLDDSVDAYSMKVYEKAKEVLTNWTKEGVLVEDKTPVFYIYRQIMEGRVQTGLVGCTAIDDYMNNIIKKHEFTRKEKEIDRINHFDITDANTEPVFLTYKKNARINDIVSKWVDENKATYDVVTDDGIAHIVWVLNDAKLVEEIISLFANIEYLYIADGHHRSASAVETGKKRRLEKPDYTGEEEFNRFLAVIFPDEDLYVMDYNRVVKDLNGLSKEDFIAKVSESFVVTEAKVSPYKPNKKHEYGMFLESKWYILAPKEGSYPSEDAVLSLDAAVLQNNLLSPILGIEDPRTDKRIDFIGGIRGLKELERRVNEDMKVAFALYPVTIDDLMGVADAGQVMPPKSTWFEPKLRSGLFVHKLS